VQYGRPMQLRDVPELLSTNCQCTLRPNRATCLCATRWGVLHTIVSALNTHAHTAYALHVHTSSSDSHTSSELPRTRTTCTCTCTLDKGPTPCGHSSWLAHGAVPRPTRPTSNTRFAGANCDSHFSESLSHSFPTDVGGVQ
jgi:hypothetical protein